MSCVLEMRRFDTLVVKLSHFWYLLQNETQDKTSETKSTDL